MQAGVRPECARREPGVRPCRLECALSVISICSQDLPEHVPSAPVEAGVRPECAYLSE